MTLDFRFLFRKKTIDADALKETKLSRCLTTLDLTALGIGSTLGAGIYVLAGDVIKNVSGPSIVISFLIAGLASVLSGLCYAEFGARVPKAGSAYVYTYVTIGEFMAFVIGWNLILEYIIGTSSVARAFSTYFDSLVENRIQQTFRHYMPINVEGLSPYPDFLAFGITLLITLVLLIGVKESSRLNNIFTGVNLFVILFVFICGAIKLNFDNWSLKPENFPSNCTQAISNITNSTGKLNCGSGGFAPFGISGVIAGAAKCFYAFVGFDCIATTGEETKNPQKAIPLSIVLALIVCCIAYIGLSGVLSLMLPYYLIDANAPMPEAFRHVGWNWARYIVAIGAICSLSTSLLGAMFPLPRVLYAISSDGLIFRSLSHINERFKTPVLATMLSGLFAAFMAMIFDLDELVNMMSIGTLLAYSLVSISVLVLRYEASNDSNEELTINNEPQDNLARRLFNPANTQATLASASLSNKILIASTVNIICLCIVLVSGVNTNTLATSYMIALVVLFGCALIVCTLALYRQPQSVKPLPFKMPCVPILPLLSILINFYLMTALSKATWIRFAVWMVLGLAVYFIYGVRNSSESGKVMHKPLRQTSSSSSSSLASQTTSIKSN